MVQISQGQNLGQHLHQELTINTSQIQSLNILAAPVMELQALVNQRLQENPVLEAVPSSNEESFDSVNEKMLADMIQIEASLGQEESVHYSSDQIATRQHFFDSLTVTASLNESLHNQLIMIDGDQDFISLISKIIDEVDKRGFLVATDESLSHEYAAPTALVIKAVKAIQAFDPSGVASRDLKDRLLIQLKHKGMNRSIAYKIVKFHLDDLAANKLPLIASALKLKLNQVNEAIEDIKSLKPSIVDDQVSEVEYIIEDVVIRIFRGEIKFEILNQKVPQVSINKRYQVMLENPITSAQDRAFIRAKMLGATELIKQLANRKSTMERVVAEIVTKQSAYFHKGNEFLVPLTMKEVATIIEVHETTVSRAVAGKYLRSPQGLVPLRIFFTGGAQVSSTSGDGDLAGIAIKAKITNMIENECKGKPLSDNKISQFLAEDGVKIARRTVAKYRESLGIPATTIRRQYK